VIELAAGALFAATVVLLFAGPFTMRGSPDASWWIRLGGWGAAPALFAVLWLWSSLLAASLIDAETGYIPLGITSLAIAVGSLAARLNNKRHQLAKPRHRHAACVNRLL
jgi:prepilin signal peptidase PulO-like enzyme (type II secretory pathway)